jgi:hypothetical protein
MQPKHGCLAKEKPQRSPETVRNLQDYNSFMIRTCGGIGGAGGVGAQWSYSGTRPPMSTKVCFCERRSGKATRAACHAASLTLLQDTIGDSVFVIRTCGSTGGAGGVGAKRSYSGLRALPIRCCCRHICCIASCSRRCRSYRIGSNKEAF